MFTRSLPVVAMTALLAATAVTQASAQSCCSCTYTCVPPPPPQIQPPQIQIWGLTPAYTVNQGPVYSGPGRYTAPIYEGEVSTVDYPYSGSSDFFDAGPNADPFRNNLYHPYWPMLRGLSLRPGRFHRTVLYHRASASRAMAAPHVHKDQQDSAGL